MHEGGYIKIYRKSIKNGWLQNPTLWCFWCWCLLEASYETHTQTVGYKRVVLEPGEFIFSYKKASEALLVNVRPLRTCVDLLKNSENLTIKSTNKYSIISITNWESYQVCENQNDKQNDKPATSKRQASDKPIPIRKEGKEERGGVGEIPDWIPIQIWKDFKEFRLRKKAPLTERAVKKTIEELERLRVLGNDPEAVLEQSIYRGWTGVFALKSEFKTASKQTRVDKVKASMEIMARREYERREEEGHREKEGAGQDPDPDVCVLPSGGL